MNKENNRHLIQTNEVSEKAKASLKVRVITSIIATAIVLPCLFLGGWLYFGLMVLTTCLGAWELVHCAKKHYNVTLYIVAILVVVLFATFPVYKALIDQHVGNSVTNNVPGYFDYYTGFDTIYISGFLLLLGIILCFSMVLIDKNFQVHDAAYLLSFGVILGLGIQSMLFLRYFPLYERYLMPDPSVAIAPGGNMLYDNLESSVLLILVVGGSLFSDMGGYFTGMLFGKNKMNERISPKKTWEGFVGGMVFSMVFTLALGFGMAATKGDHAIIAIFNLDNWYYLLIISIIIPIVSPLGDFIFSSVKRYYNVKDFGYILPGHGGILDRIDSVLFASICISMLIIFFSCIESGNWGNLLI